MGFLITRCKQQSFLICKSCISFVTFWLNPAWIAVHECLHYSVISLHRQCNFIYAAGFLSPPPSRNQWCSPSTTLSLVSHNLWKHFWKHIGRINCLICLDSKVPLMLYFSSLGILCIIGAPVLQCPFDSFPSSKFQSQPSSSKTKIF